MQKERLNDQSAVTDAKQRPAQQTQAIRNGNNLIGFLESLPVLFLSSCPPKADPDKFSSPLVFRQELEVFLPPDSAVTRLKSVDGSAQDKGYDTGTILFEAQERGMTPGSPLKKRNRKVQHPTTRTSIACGTSSKISSFT
jgi:hypothetical protein